MLTIRHIMGDGGHETIVQATNINVVPAQVRPPNTDHITSLRYRSSPDIEYSMNVAGTVFVMNDNGKTVARYEIVDPVIEP
jgi:hypothetical protein